MSLPSQTAFVSKISVAFVPLDTSTAQSIRDCLKCAFSVLYTYRTLIETDTALFGDTHGGVACGTCLFMCALCMASRSSTTGSPFHMEISIFAGITVGIEINVFYAYCLVCFGALFDLWGDFI